MNNYDSIEFDHSLFDRMIEPFYQSIKSIASVWLQHHGKQKIFFRIP